MIRRILRKFVPTILKKAKGHLRYTWYWFKRDLKFSSLSGSKESRLAFLMVNSHVLEKGLTMPNRKLGFGYKKVREIISYCSSCIKDFGTDSVEVQSTLDDLNEYLQIHRDSQFGLPEDIENRISDLLKYRKSHNKLDSYYFTKDTFFKPVKNFEEFAYSRHTVRHYSSEPVDVEKIKHCIKIAQTAPSACNRQATRVKIISSEEKKKVVLELQNGNRGFGYLADKILLITTEQGAWGADYRMLACVDAGIFTMNLLYALHANEICACTLNAHMNSEKISQLQKSLGIPESEFPVVFVAIGNPQKEFMVARSFRLDTEKIVQIIDY